jgi:hypothetical protein
VKSIDDLNDGYAAFEDIYVDIAIKDPSGVKRSVVVLSANYGNDPDTLDGFRDAIEPLLN